MHGLWADSADRLHFQMISFSLDPQWCGLLYSICSRHEKGGGVLGGDAFGVCSATAPLDADWLAFAGSVGVELCHFSSSWALVLDTVKTGGVILLLGVGSFVCYKLYHYYRPGSRSRFSSPDSTPPHAGHKDFIFYRVREDNQLIEDLDDEDISSIEGRYFGPSPAPSKNNLKHGLNVAAYLKKSNFFCNHCPSSSSSHSEIGTPCEERHGAVVSEENNQEKFSRGSSASSPCGIGQLSRLARAANPSRERGSRGSSLLRKFSQESNSPTWFMKRLRIMLAKSQQNKQNSEHGFTSLPVTPGKRSRHKTKGRKSVANWEDGWRTVSQGMSREERKSAYRDSSPCSLPYLSGACGNNGLPLSSQPHLPRDESFDSLGFSKRLPREGSFDSTCSELSFDFSLPEAPQETSTMLCLENLQQEIDLLKNNCLMMDEEFETIKCNRNLPGLSSLMTANVSSKNSPLDGKDQSPQDALQETLKLQNARACFAGLYSLTTIKNSTSSELSDSINGNGRASVGSAESLAWDSPIAFASPVRMPMDDILEDSRNMPDIINSTSLNDLHSGIEPTMSKEYEGVDIPHSCEAGLINVETDSATALEWDEEGLDKCADFVGEAQLMETCGFPNINSHAEDNVKDLKKHKVVEFSSMMESMMSTRSSVSERSMKTESGYESKLTDSTITNSSSQLYGKWDQSNNFSRSASFESGCSAQDSQLMWNENVCSPTSMEVAINVGERVGVIEYAEREWQGESDYAKTILKAYLAIPAVLGTHFLRGIRGDNYCGIRAAIFQILSHGCPIPNVENVISQLSAAFQQGENSWLCDWNFAERLNYQDNILVGMQKCLKAVEYLATEVSNAAEKETCLTNYLNHNPALDVHVMEGVKLIMMNEALALYKASSQGNEVPFFVTLMFARDTCETPRDLMNNHLKNVGNAEGVEQVEMFLLGYAFQVTLRVVRPSAYGKADFICCYPDCNVGHWPYVLLIAEDDRHYNVLVE